MDLIQNQSFPINPERRDSSTIKNREDIGLGRVDNLSAADLLRLMGEKTKSEVNKTEYHEIKSSDSLYELFSVSDSTYISFYISVVSSGCTSGISKIDLFLADSEVKAEVFSFGMTGAKLLIYDRKCVLKLPSIPGDGSILEGVKICYYYFDEAAFSPEFKIFSPGSANPRREISLKGDNFSTSLPVYDQSGQPVSGYPYNRNYDYPTINGTPFTGEKGELRNINITANHSGPDLSRAGEHDWEVLNNIPVNGTTIEKKEGVEIIKSSISLLSERASEDFGLCRTINSWGSIDPSSEDDDPRPAARAYEIFESLNANDNDVVTLGFLKSLLFPVFKTLATADGLTNYFNYEAHIDCSVPSRVIEVASEGGDKPVTFTGYARGLALEGYQNKTLEELWDSNQLRFSPGSDHPHIEIDASEFPNVWFTFEANNSTNEIVEEVILSTVEDSGMPKASCRLKFIQAPSSIISKGYLIYQVDDNLPIGDITLDNLALQGGTFCEDLSWYNFMLPAKGYSASESGIIGKGGRYAIFLAEKSESGNISIIKTNDNQDDPGKLVPNNKRDLKYGGNYTDVTLYGLKWGYSLYPTYRTGQTGIICKHKESFALLDFKDYPENTQMDSTNFLGEIGLFYKQGRKGYGDLMSLQIHQNSVEPILTLENESLNLPYTASDTGYISYTSNPANITIIPGDNYTWLTFTNENNTIHFDVLQNYGAQPRTAFYKITNGYINKEIYVTQQGPGVHWAVEGFDDESETVVLYFVPEGETKTIKISSDIQYKMENVESPESGRWPIVYNGSTPVTEDSILGLSGETTSYEFRIQALPQDLFGGHTKSAVINLVSVDDDNIRKAILLEQSKYENLVVNISPDSLVFLPTGTQNKTVKITSTDQYILKSDSDWIQVDPETGGRVGALTRDEPVIVTCLTDNPNAGVRTGTIQAYESIGEYLVKRGELTVKQNGNLILTALVSGGGSSKTVSYEDTIIPIVISTNTNGWEVDEETIPDWIKLSEKSGSSAVNTINAAVAENAGSERSCTIIFNSKFGGSSTSASITISQEAGSTSVEYLFYGLTPAGAKKIAGSQTNYNFTLSAIYYKKTTVNGKVVSHKRYIENILPDQVTENNTVLSWELIDDNKTIKVSGISQNTEVSDKTHTLNISCTDINGESRATSIEFISSKVVSLESVYTLDEVDVYSGKPTVSVLTGFDSRIKFKLIPEFYCNEISIDLPPLYISTRVIESSLGYNAEGQFLIRADQGSASLPENERTVKVIFNGQVNNENVNLTVPIIIKPVPVLSSTGNYGFHPCSDSYQEDPTQVLTSDSNGETILGNGHNWEVSNYGVNQKTVTYQEGDVTHWMFTAPGGHTIGYWVIYIAGQTGTGGTTQVVRFLEPNSYSSNDRIYLTHEGDNVVSIGGLEGSLWSIFNENDD